MGVDMAFRLRSQIERYEKYQEENKDRYENDTRSLMEQALDCYDEPHVERFEINEFRNNLASHIDDFNYWALDGKTATQCVAMIGKTIEEMLEKNKQNFDPDVYRRIGVLGCVINGIKTRLWGNYDEYICTIC